MAMADSETASESSPPRLAIVADDDEFFRIALTTILKTRLGFSEVYETASLDAALEKLAETPGVTLALFDLAMPGMAGAASLSAVRECFPDVTAVVVSGSTDRNDVLLALKAGVHGFIAKAVGVEDLTRALTMVVDGWIHVPAFITDVSRISARDQEVPSAGADAPSRQTGRQPDAVALTPRQRQVLGLLVRGLTNKEMARELDLGEGTVKIHVAALLKALDVPNRSAAAVYGARLAANQSPAAQR